MKKERSRMTTDEHLMLVDHMLERTRRSLAAAKRSVQQWEVLMKRAQSDDLRLGREPIIVPLQ